jgi:hypothetical protein
MRMPTCRYSLLVSKMSYILSQTVSGQGTGYFLFVCFCFFINFQSVMGQYFSKIQQKCCLNIVTLTCQKSLYMLTLSYCTYLNVDTLWTGLLWQIPSSFRSWACHLAFGHVKSTPWLACWFQAAPGISHLCGYRGHQSWPSFPGNLWEVNVHYHMPLRFSGCLLHNNIWQVNHMTFWMNSNAFSNNFLIKELSQA